MYIFFNKYVWLLLLFLYILGLIFFKQNDGTNFVIKYDKIRNIRYIQDLDNPGIGYNPESQNVPECITQNKESKNLFTTNIDELNEVPTFPTTTQIADQPADETVLLPAALEILKNFVECKPRDFSREIYQRGEYWVLKNYVKAEHGDLDCYGDVTFVTHGDFTYMENLEFLIERWQGPISLSLYAPGDDFDATVDSIRYMRDCSKMQALIRQWVSFHVYFHKNHMPRKVFTEDILKDAYVCDGSVPYKVNSSDLYKQQNKLVYPVNVGRNVARDAALTHYFLSLDIELYPNRKLGARFLNMMARNISLINPEHPSVFVMKPFEIREDQTVPENKTQLIEMLIKKSAIPFHQSMCPSCHKTPHEHKWTTQGETEYMEITGAGKRIGQFQSWEPLFISTHSIPHLEERLSWEGKRDKMTQTYVLCVMDYNFMILSNAFVTHHPGIKVYEPDTTRDTIVAKQNYFIDRILTKELNVLYGRRSGCKL